MTAKDSLPRQRLLKFADYLSHCAPEAANYGRCVSEKAEKINHNACAKEFQLLFDCFKKQVCFYNFIFISDRFTVILVIYYVYYINALIFR